MLNFSLNHVAVAVKDVNESVEFYQKVFQFDEIENTASNSTTRWLSIGDGKQIHLIPRPDAEIKLIKAIHFALATPDIDAFVKRLESFKIPYADWHNTPSGDYIRKDGVVQFYFQDPNGYWIEVNNAV